MAIRIPLLLCRNSWLAPGLAGILMIDVSEMREGSLQQRPNQTLCLKNLPWNNFTLFIQGAKTTMDLTFLISKKECFVG